MTATGAVVAARRPAIRCRRPGPGGQSRIRRIGGGRRRSCWRGCGRRPALREGIGLSGQMHGLVALDSDDRVLRPAILWNDQRTGAECARDRGDARARAADRADRQPRAPGFTAPKLLWLRHNEPDVFARGSRGSRCRRTTSGCASAASTRPTSPTPPGRCCWTSPSGAGARRCSTRSALERAWLPRVLESPQVSGATADGVPVAAGAGDQAAGALGVGVDRPGPVSVVLGTSGVVFAALERFAADPQARVHAFCHAVPGTWHAMGVMLSAAGSLRWLQAILGADYDVLTAEASALAADDRGAPVPALSRRRAHAARRPRRARRLRGPQPAPRPRRARARAARGRRLRPARLARSDLRARRAAGARARVGRRRAQRGVAADRRLRARAAARARRGRGRGGVRRRAARRRRRRRLAGRPDARSPRRCARAS